MAATALAYLYVPLAARDPRTFAWGAPRDLSALADYLRGADYAHNQGIELRAWSAHAAALAADWTSQGVLPLLLLGLGALLALGARAPGLRLGAPLVAATTIGFVAANVVFHPDVPDYDGYVLATLALSAVGIAALASTLARRGARFRVYGALLALLPLAALAVSPAHLAGPRDTPSLARAMAEGALDEAPRDAVILVEADHWIAPLLYVQEVEGRRPDVVVIARGLAASSWYWEHLHARHPTLTRVALRGPGGRDGRVARLLDANPERVLLAESFALAAQVGRRPCAVGWLVLTGACDVRSERATRAIRQTAPLRAEARQVAGRVGEARGEALWRLGHGDAAARAFLAGLDEAPPLPEHLPPNAPPLGGPLPPWSRDAALHDVARNYALAGLLLDAMGRRDLALHSVDHAIDLGLTDARAARQRILRGAP